MHKSNPHSSKSLFTQMGVVFVLLFAILPAVPALDHYERNGIHSNCNFFDTVNVTGYPTFPNGSYNYNGIIIPSYYVSTYDYYYKDLVDRIDVSPHQRGCVCKLKTCINLCCPWGEVYDLHCHKPINATQLWPEPMINVTLKNGSIELVDFNRQFTVQNFRPCPEMYALIPQVNEYDSYQIFENGSLLREDDMVILSKNEYCLVPTVANLTDQYYTIAVANCDTFHEGNAVRMVNGFAMLFSIPFMLLTIVVYLLIPELRNQHGKSLVCYLLGLSVGYLAMCYTTLLSRNVDPTSVPCKAVGYTGYFAFMSAFFWLNVISFDLWHNFRGTRGVNRFQENRRFLYYSLYSWGSALCFLVFTLCVQEYSDWPTHLKPGIGGGEFCWLDMSNWAPMIYFNGPILIIIIANTVMFVMTAVKIHGVQREMARIIAREDSTKNLRNEKDKFGLFLRLFLIMGVTWSCEIISYCVGSDKTLSKIFYISDLCNAMQGFLIFMLFVMKKKVKHLITNRLLKNTSPSSSQSSSTHSTSTEISTPKDKLKMKTSQQSDVVRGNGKRPNEAPSNPNNS